MKGIVFCEFINMVDTAISPEMTETIIEKSNLPSKGAYTAVGTYDHSEIVSLVSTLSQETGTSVSALVHAFGGHLFGVLANSGHVDLEGIGTSYELLERVDGYIHVEVQKLYPDATLPEIKTERLSDNEMLVKYSSERGMGDLAHGLIEACVNHFEENIKIDRKDIAQGPVQEVHFFLKKM